MTDEYNDLTVEIALPYDDAELLLDRLDVFGDEGTKSLMDSIGYAIMRAKLERDDQDRWRAR